MSEIELQREHERQQALMGALLSRDGGDALQAWLAHSHTRRQRGMLAYQVNASASAERALAAMDGTPPEEFDVRSIIDPG